MLQLSNIKKLTTSEVWYRGKNYFQNGLVRRLENNGNHWSAKVEGTYNYRVSLEIVDNEVTSWDCNCPFDYSPVCKHIAAVALAINEQMELGEPEVLSSTIQEKQTPTPINIKDIPAKELKNFCMQYAKQNPDFKESLVLYFNNPSPKKKVKVNYAKKLAKAINTAADRDGYIDYYHAPTALNEVFDFLDKAEELFNKNNFDEAFEIAQTIFEQVADICQYMDDSDGYGIDSLERSQQIIYNVVNADFTPIEFKNMVFEWLMREYPKEKYDYLGEDMLFDLLIDASKLLNKIEHALPIVEKALEHTNSNYRKEQLLSVKIDLLKLEGQSDQADQLFNQYLHIPGFREKRLQKLLKEKKYPEAEKLVREGIEIAKGDHHLGTEANWYKHLMEIYNKTGNLKKQLETARWLFKNAGPNNEYLENLKTFFTPESWISERNKLIVWLKKENNNWFLSELYANEKMYPQLFALVKYEPYWGNLQKYGKLLMKDYGEEILIMYSAALQRSAEIANTRKNYRELVGDLKSIKNLKGGNALIKRLVAEFRQTYKKRPAMIEELSVF